MTPTYTARLVLVLCMALAGASGARADTDRWSGTTADGDHQVRLYFFWTRTCPHCQRARPDMDALARELPWVDLRSLEISRNRDNGALYVELARAVGERPQSVPAFLWCGQMVTGYDSAEGIGAYLREELAACRDRLARGESLLAVDAEPEATPLVLPGLGDVDLSQWSLPLVAVTLGALDSFNPCAFFVLLFLLSLLVNAGSRARMFLIGGLFVSVSGIVYFMFMAAWLNLFLMVGQLQWITLGAGLLALTFGVLNVKDFFRPGDGPSLSIADDAKPNLFRRMRRLIAAESLPSMIGGTLVLAVFANAYELLCTAGFPMVFTRILTLEALPLAGYYAYLALYCLVYVLPLFAIVSAFALTLGRRKLSEYEGRLLKVMSGLMMGGLGLLLVFKPDWLNHLGVTTGLLAVVVAATFLLHWRFRPASRS